jgi:transcription antitermination factor NusG
MLRGYALVTFDPGQPVPLTFWREGAAYQCNVHWSQLGALPGVSRIFHDGRRPLPVLGMSRQLERALGIVSDAPTDAPEPDTSRYAVGDVLRIADGPLRSYLARVERAVHGVYTAQVEIFGRTCSTEFTEDQLEAA